MSEITERTFAAISAVSYKEPSEFAGTVIDQFDSFTPIQVAGSEAVVLQRGDLCVVAFRGTTTRTWMDLITDVKVLFPRKSRYGLVHRGFDDYVARVFWKVVHELKKQQPKEIWLTGHSLGAAAATRVAEELLYNCWGESCKIGLVTFGSPRVFDERAADVLFAKIETSRHFRFVLGADVSARTPPAFHLWPLPQYRHVKGADYIASDGKVYRNADPLFITADTSSRLVSDGFDSWVSDHSAVGYSRALRDWVRFRRANYMDPLIAL